MSQQPYPRSPPPGSAAGFQLAELMIALAVLALLITLAVPGFQSLLVRNRLATISNDLLWLFIVARSEALSRGTRVTVCRTANPAAALPTCTGPGSSWSEGAIVFVDNGLRSPPQPADLAAILQVRNGVDAGYTVARNGISSGWFSFSGNGRLKSGTLGTSFKVSGPPGSFTPVRQVCVAMTGRARIAEGNSCD